MKYGINKQQNDVINAIQVSGSISNLEAITKYGIGGKKSYYKAYYIEDKSIYDNVVIRGS